MTLKELRDARAKLIHDLDQLRKKVHETEKRNFTKEEQASIDKIIKDASELRAQIEEAEAQEQLDRQVNELTGELRQSAGRQTDPGQPSSSPQRRSRPTSHEESQVDAEYRAAYRDYLRQGEFRMSPERRQVLENRGRPNDSEQRNIQTGITGGATGGYLIAPLYTTAISQAMALYQGVREAGSEHFTTQTGASLPFPNADDTANEAQIVAEANDVKTTQSSPTPIPNLTFAQTPLATYMYTTGVILVSLQMLTDAFFPIESYINGRIAERMGRGTNRDWTVGSGTGEPKGIVTAIEAAPSGINRRTATRAGFTSDDIIALKHTVDPVYRQRGQFAMSDQVFLRASLLKDNIGRYLLAQLQADVQPTLAGKPVNIFTKMPGDPDAGTGLWDVDSTLMLFGDFSHYKTREVTDMMLFRIDQLYLQQGQIGFLAMGRYGGTFVNPGNWPVRALRVPSA